VDVKDPTGGPIVCIESIQLREVKEVETPKAFKPYFTGVTVYQASPSNVGGRGAALGVGGRGG
jgi:hypothetical protein